MLNSQGSQMGVHNERASDLSLPEERGQDLGMSLPWL